MKKYFLLLLLTIPSLGFTQPHFFRYDGYQVKISGNDITLPWAGGLNFIQTSNIDLNQDGINDLFLFDRTGNKIRTFVNNGIASTVDYTYAPQYENSFPQLHDWVLLVDYNGDGKADIFTYTLFNGAAGIAVYKNTSSIASGLQFTLAKNLLYSTYSPPNINTKYNLYVSSIDIPAISDIDSDGDMDIVTFSNGGVYLEYHQNKSKDLHGISDSLIYEVKNHCWGYASENYLTNFFTLNDTCVMNVSNPQLQVNTSEERNNRHSGSCELCIDLNGDGVKDFIAGDISYKNLTMLTNNGTTTASHFFAADAAFPLNNGGVAVDLTIFPCAFSVDINNDGKNDLIVSPNAPGGSENFTSMVYYENIGTANFPVFQFQQTDVLQDNMIDVGEGAYPALFDYDNDGLKDLFVGNYGYYASPLFQSKIALFKNTGSNTVPKFELITRDYNNYSSLALLNMIPSFGDLDNDGDSDMIIGSNDGRMHYFENTATVGAPANFVLIQANFKNSNNRTIDIGDAAAPHIADVDGDGKTDLVIGSRNGKLAYYKRVSTTGFPQMDSVSHFWGGINVTAPLSISGCSFPYVYKHAGKTELLIGTESGYLKRYDNIDGNLTGIFNLVDAAFLNSREGAKSAPCGADINNDGLWDLFVGNYSGGITFFKGSTTTIQQNENKIDWNFEAFPNPANNAITVHVMNHFQKHLKMEVYTVLGQLVFSEQINTNLIQISTEKFSPGLYIFKVSETNSNGTSVSGALSKRIIIQH